MAKRISKEKKDTIEIKNIPDFSAILGCCGVGDNFIHLGTLFTRVTVCGKSMGDTIMSRNITIDCPECVAELRYRGKHPKATKEEMGVITHKRKK